MDTILNFIETRVAKPLTTFSQLKYNQIIQKVVVGISPLLTINSLLLLVKDLSFLRHYSEILFIVGNLIFFLVGPLSLLMTVFYLVEYYKIQGEEIDYVQPIIFGISAYILSIYFNSKNLSYGNLTSYFFIAIFFGLITVEIYRYSIHTSKNIGSFFNIPPMVILTLYNLKPALEVLLICFVFKYVDMDLNFIINNLKLILDSGIFMVFTTILNRLLWALGIHGSNSVAALGGFILNQMSYANIEAALNGLKLPYTFTSVFIENYIWTGLFPLSVCLCFTKSKRLKDLGLMSISSSIFNIGEPLIFGLPLMLNPLMMVPFVVSYGLLAFLAYIFASLNLIPVPLLLTPWVIPAPFRVLIATKGSIAACIFVLAGWLLVFMCFLPFVRRLDKNELENESK